MKFVICQQSLLGACKRYFLKRHYSCDWFKCGAPIVVARKGFSFKKNADKSIDGSKSAKESALHKVYAEQRLLGFSKEQMFDVVMDVGAYEKFLPWCQSSKVPSRRKEYITAELKVGLPPLTETYTSVVSFDKPSRIHAESKHGRLFQELVNHWEFLPGLRSHPSSTCVVKFHVSFVYKSAISAKLGNVFFDDTAKAMTLAFYEEAKRRYGQESMPPKKIQIVPKSNTESNSQSD